MKKTRRIMSFAAAAMLCIGANCNSVLAASGTFPDVPPTAEYAQAVETLAEMGIFAGDKKGNFNPDQSITRAEAATIICKLMGVAEEANKMKGSSTFSDVPSTHWANGYIAKAAELGVISGYGKGKFGPNDSVTYEQFIKMLISAWGYENEAIKQGGWPNGYLAVAQDMGFYEKSKDATNFFASRSVIAQLVYNAILLPTNYEGGDIDETM